MLSLTVLQEVFGGGDLVGKDGHTLPMLNEEVVEQISKEVLVLSSAG